MGAGVAGACVLAWLVVLSVYDIRERRLPNWLTMPGALVILAVAAVAGRGVPALLGAIGLAGLYLVVHLISPAAMGAGDVKLAVGVGGLTGAFGFDVWALAALIAPLLTGVMAAVVRRSSLRIRCPAWAVDVSCDPRSRGARDPLEGWWFVAFGDVGVVEFAFGVDGLGGGVGAGVSAFGHHHAAVAAGVYLGGSPVHRVAVGSQSFGNRCKLPVGLVQMMVPPRPVQKVFRRWWHRMREEHSRGTLSAA